MALTRRKFLIGTAITGGGLYLGFQLMPEKPFPHTVDGSFQPNAWLQLFSDGRILFQLDKAEMGQGVMTSLAMTIAEELDVNPARIHVQFSGIHPAYINTSMGLMVTGASSSTFTTYMPLREAGAGARAILLNAAADLWKLPASELETNDGQVLHRSGKQVSYANLVDVAKTLNKDVEFSLKKPEEFKWIGKPLPRFDTPIKSDGSARFGIDIDFDNIKVACVRRCPHFGGKLKSFDADSVNNMPGVLAVFEIHSGVAVVADSYWQARQACNSLDVEWSKGPLAGLSSQDIRKNQEHALQNQDPVYQLDEGDFIQAHLQADNSIEAVYAAPYQHHSPMEPQNTTAMASGGYCEVWSPSQAPDIARAVIAHYTSIPRENITVHQTLLGGAFGRRGYVDFAGEAGAIAEKYPDVPVKLVWSREDDMQHDYYRPGTLHGMKAGFKDGKIVSWQHHLVSTSIIQGFGVDMATALLPAWVPSDLARKMGQGSSDLIAKYDPTMAEGAVIPYDIDNRQAGSILYDPGIRTGFWRSVAHSHNAFVVESFVDECANAIKANPVVFRRNHLKNKPRHLGVLEEVLKLSGYDGTQADMGIAVHESFQSYVAQVAKIKLADNDNGFVIEKVYCAVDCGQVINPDIVIAQMESGIVYGLSATLKQGVSFSDGAVVESNFHDLPVLRMNECPDIEVSIVESKLSPGGVGEIAVPPIAPAVANAVFNLTGQRLRELPLLLQPDPDKTTQTQAAEKAI